MAEATPSAPVVEEYNCQSVAVNKYLTTPRTFGEFLKCVNNPEDVKILFSKLKLTVIYFINYGHHRFGEYFYYQDVNTLFNQTEGAIKLELDSVDYQHVFVLTRNESNILESELHLLLNGSRKSTVVNVSVTSAEYDEFTKLASEMPN